MPVKILLADKSITIQKVVEMLFSGRDYEVVCVSDGETALNEAKRVVPDVVLVDIDLPRIDGYSFAARLKQTPLLAQAPVILMMSRDDVYDGAKGKQAGIIDNIAKPFESQELIGKVKKAIAEAPPRRAASPAVCEPAAPAPPPAPAKPTKAAAPPDIFDIINEAPTPADLARAAAPVEEESLYEVEPVVEEVETPLARDVAKALPVGAKAVEEMRAGLGLIGEKEKRRPENVTIESLEKAMGADQSAAFTPITPSPPPQRPIPSSVQPPTLPEGELRKMAEEAVARMAKEVFANLPPVQPPTLPEGELRKMAEEAVARMAKDVFANLPPIQPPQLSDEALRGMVEERVSSMTKEALEKATAAQPPALSPSDMWSIAEEAVQGIAKEYFKQQPLTQAPQPSDEALRGMVEERVSSMTKEALEKATAAQPPALSPSDMWSVAEEAVEKIAKEYFEKQPVTQAPQLSDETLRDMVDKMAAKTVEELLEKKAIPSPSIPEIPENELRKMAEETISRMALDVFKDLTPPMPKISEETVRRGIEEAVMRIAHEVAREVIEKVAWEVVPHLAEVMIQQEVERLKVEG